VEIDPELPRALPFTVPDHQLSLAIGNKGHNGRMAARLTDGKSYRPRKRIMTEKSDKNQARRRL
jgi:N utilization substance protein A